MSAESNITNAETASGEQMLRPVSIRLLYEGMVIHDDIFDSGGERLLITAGNTLTIDHIERMHRINNGADIIYVTGRTHKTMVSKRPNIEIARRVDLENSNGYTSTLKRVTELYQDITDNNKVNRDGFCDVAGELSERTKSTSPSVTLSLINAITPEDEFLQRHVINVGMLNGLLGLWLGLPDEQIDKLVLLGLLHDCGQALMPMEILQAPRIFTKIDHEVIKVHAVRAEELLSEFPDDIHHTASTHHERIDGSGYPSGIKGDAVTGAARITAISDIYEAVVSTRPHRSPRSPFHVLAMFDKMASKQIDSSVVNVLKEYLPQELIDRPVTMSDGTIGIIREYDHSNIEYPKVEIGKRIISTNENLHCVSMYNDE